jgi:hypothetical protein
MAFEIADASDLTIVGRQLCWVRRASRPLRSRPLTTRCHAQARKTEAAPTTLHTPV